MNGGFFKLQLKVCAAKVPLILYITPLDIPDFPRSSHLVSD